MKLQRLSPHLWEIAAQDGMRVPGRVYWPIPNDERVGADQAVAQVANVARLPGIVGYSLAMPDVHLGYGFPIGGVAAMDCRDGAVSPGGVGYDINCGVRLLATDLQAAEVRGQTSEIANEILRAVPVGIGSEQAIPTLSNTELSAVLRRGAAWAIEQGFHLGDYDHERCEDEGCLADADPECVSDRARERGRDQLGTLGSGNHFIELCEVSGIDDDAAATAFGLRLGQLAIQIHTGSRGLGHQVCDDAVGALARCMGEFGSDYRDIPDRQLASAPIQSAAGEEYLGAMRSAANFAWANRQIIGCLVAQALEHALGRGPADVRARLVYDASHNLAKLETHCIDGRERRLLVHRKGAIRASPPGDPRLAPGLRKVGAPVLVPGDMGRGSYVLAANPKAAEATLASACHGAGRRLSRHQALQKARGRSIEAELRGQGIVVVARSRRTLGEEMSEAYKDVTGVVQSLASEGIVRIVARLKPMAVVKG